MLYILVFLIGVILMALVNANKNDEMQSLINSSRKSLADAEDKVEKQKEEIVDLKNNIEFLYNNLSAQKKKLVRPDNQD